MRTIGVKNLVNEVLASLPRPYTEDIIDEVFHAIEHNSTWRQEYDAQCDELGKAVVNTWGGYWVANALEKLGVQQVSSVKSTLISSYSKLAASDDASGKKRKEPVALQLMSDYFHKHKDELPSEVRDHRNLIVELIMEGSSPEQAFAMVRANVT